MRKVIIWSLFLAVFACACATTGKQQETASIWTYEKDAIMLNFKSDRKLNLRNRKPQNLALCVYQLKNTEAFNKLAGDEVGLRELQECEVFDLSMAEGTRIIAKPGQDVTMTIDRAEGARYVAVVAGYPTVERGRIARLYQIPALPEKVMFWNSRTLKPKSVRIDLILGATQLQDPGR